MGTFARKNISLFASSMNKAIHHLLQTTTRSQTDPARNNACWSLGHFCMALKSDIQPYQEKIFNQLMVCLKDLPSNHCTMTVSFALGRLGYASPEWTSQRLHRFGKQLCECCWNKDNKHRNLEMQDAFKGLCAMISCNPKQGLKIFKYFCEAVYRCDPVERRNFSMEICDALLRMKSESGDEWSAKLLSLAPEVRMQITQIISPRILRNTLTDVIFDFVNSI